MTKEIQILSVFAPPALVTAAGAGLLIFALRRLLSRVGFYHLVWHPGLFDLALFVVLWSGLSLLLDAT